MKKFTKVTVLLTVLLTATFYIQTSFSQTMEMLNIEHLKDESIIIPAQCDPENLIILINSSIENLNFVNHALPDDEYSVLRYPEKNQYIICTPKIKQMITVSGPNLQPQDMEIFDMNIIHAYNITANIVRGTATIITNPGNASVYLESLNFTTSSGQSFTNNSGTYRVKILKPNYVSIDTLITLPSNDSVVYNFTLKPNFANLQLDITTEDNLKFDHAPILWINDKRISLDALIKPELYKRFYDGVEFFNLYENNLIPLVAGNYKVRLESDNYIPFETFVNIEESKTSKLKVSLELIYGFVTIIDAGENALGAKVFINDVHKGDVPLFKARTKVGTNIIRFEKDGFMTEKPTYEVYIAENSNHDFYVNMRVSKEITIDSEPKAAMIFLNNEHIGFTPTTTAIPAGDHQLIIKRANYATEKRTINTNRDFVKKDTLKFNLLPVNPFTFTSEIEKLKLRIEGINEISDVLLDSVYVLPAVVQLPKGNYFLTTSDSRGLTYKGTVRHKDQKNSGVKLPSYSRLSFSTITFDYINKDDMEAAFGSVHIFSRSGLSTSIANVNFLNVDIDGKTYNTFVPYVFFMNWDWRMGGSITRFLDINLLGRIKYTPGLDVLKFEISGLYDAAMLQYFYGFEISTRFSYFNVYTRLGSRTYDGEIFIPESEVNPGDPRKIKVNKTAPYVSVGFRWNGIVGKSNNMLRLWYKPLSNRAVDYFKEKAENNTDKVTTPTAEKEKKPLFHFLKRKN